jgi:hypothetical protein
MDGLAAVLTRVDLVDIYGMVEELKGERKLVSSNHGDMTRRIFHFSLPNYQITERASYGRFTFSVLNTHEVIRVWRFLHRR